MSRFQIHGRRTISGTHRVSGNKNAALPMIAASLLTSESVTLENVPDISDVAAMLAAAGDFGAKVERDLRSAKVTITTPKIRSAKIDAKLAARIRTSFLFAGPLLARAGRASLPPRSRCSLRRRTSRWPSPRPDSRRTASRPKASARRSEPLEDWGIGGLFSG